MWCLGGGSLSARDVGDRVARVVGVEGDVLFFGYFVFECDVVCGLMSDVCCIYFKWFIDDDGCLFWLVFYKKVDMGNFEYMRIK